MSAELAIGSWQSTQARWTRGSVAANKVSPMARAREVGRGERVLPGLWRLRLPLPWPGVPHGNAWAIASGSGVVLVDTGMHEPGSMAQLERAMEQVNLRVEHVRLLACTHAHSDHWGQAAPIRERAGCEFLIHPRYRDTQHERPGDARARRLEVARQSGVSEAAISAYLERIKDIPSGVAAAIEPDRDLVPGVEIETDLGVWTVHETPGHTPSHICLFQAERRLLISGDHVMGRISLFFDFGYSPDPVSEFLASLDRVDRLDARLALSGHGKPFVDVHGHIEGNRRLVAERIEATLDALGSEPQTALEMAPTIYGEPIGFHNGNWLLTQTLCYLHHLELQGRARREPDGDTEFWRAA
jgi:glyoxylase-like metal-dependent hydrolase (beta-lactamase superfamily II)